MHVILVYIDETSDSFWNRVRIVFVALDGNRNGRSMKLIQKRFEQLFSQLETFKDEMDVVKINNLNMPRAQRREMAEIDYEDVHGKKFELHDCYHVLEESIYADFFHYY